MHVVATSLCEEHGFCKKPQTHIRLIAGEGVEGDAHRGRKVQHLYLMRQNPEAPNLCQVHLFASEMLDELTAKGFTVQPGEIGENLLTQGVDLLSLPLGTLLHIGETTLEVTGLRTPCSQINGHRSGLQQLLWGARDAKGQRTRRAGIMTIVLTGGLIHPNDSIRIELPPEPHQPLGPV
jgi:MOSC domain-containing protein YiiM